MAQLNPAQRTGAVQLASPLQSTRVVPGEASVSEFGQLREPEHAALQVLVCEPHRIPVRQELSPLQVTSHWFALQETALGQAFKPEQLTLQFAPAQVTPAAQLLFPEHSTSQLSA